MFCPECKAEYRPGFTHCVDCDLDLVDALPPAQEDNSARPSPLHDPRIIWIGDSESDCVALCQLLKKSDIPYDVAQQVKEERGRMEVAWRYELGVSAADEERAKDLLQLPEKVVEWNSETPAEEDENQALLEYPEGIGSDADEPRRRRDYLKAFYPEDAAVEIWQAGPEGDSGVQAALQENYIRVRVAPQSDGSRKLFVLPEDEAAAREIVREIAGDSPYPDGG
jgi:hypothetical protein